MMYETFVRLCRAGTDVETLNLQAELEAEQIPFVVRPSRQKSEVLHSAVHHSLGLRGFHEIAVPQEHLERAEAVRDAVIRTMAERYRREPFRCPECAELVSEQAPRLPWKWIVRALGVYLLLWGGAMLIEALTGPAEWLWVVHPAFWIGLVLFIGTQQQVNRFRCRACGHRLTQDEIDEQRLSWDESDPLFEGVDFGEESRG